MLLEGALKQVGSGRGNNPPPPGVGAEIFRMYVRKEIDFKTYLEMNAVTVANDAYNIKPRSFPVLPGALRAYCQERIQQRREYDAESGKRLGVWVWRCIRVSEENTQDVSLLVWAKEKLAPTGLKSELAAIEEALPDFSNAKVPYEDLYLATETQKLDALAREKNR